MRILQTRAKIGKLGLGLGLHLSSIFKPACVSFPLLNP